jgi:hypothetical protein
MADLSSILNSLFASKNPEPATNINPTPLPNGGLEGDALQQYIAAHPAPVTMPSKAPIMPMTIPGRAVASLPELDKQALKGEVEPTPNKLLELGKAYEAKKANPTINPPSVGQNISTLLGTPEEQLAKAQDEQRKLRFAAMIQKAGDQINHAFTPLAHHNDLEEELRTRLAQSEAPVNDVKERLALNQDQLKKHHLEQQALNEAAMNDPNSIKSQEYRKVAGISDPAVPASAIEKLVPILAKKDSVQDKKQTRLDEQSLKYSKMMGEDLDPNRARSGEMGKNQARVNSAERIETLLKQFPDGNIPKIQTRELATSVGALLSNGSSTAVSQIDELVPHTMKGNAAKIAEWVTGDPQGSQQQKFIKLYADTAAREKQTAAKQIVQAQVKKAFSTHKKLKDLDPDAFYSNLSAATGLDTDQIKDMEKQKGFKGQLLDEAAPKPAVKPHHQDDEAVKWANANPKDPRAAAILKANGL